MILLQNKVLGTYMEPYVYYISWDKFHVQVCKQICGFLILYNDTFHSHNFLCDCSPHQCCVSSQGVSYEHRQMTYTIALSYTMFGTIISKNLITYIMLSIVIFSLSHHQQKIANG